MTTTKAPSPAAQVATAARAAIKQARKDGTLTLPDGAKHSVCSSYFAGGCSVDISITGIEQDWVLGPDEGPYGPQKTDAAKELGAALKAILTAATDGHCWGEIRVGGIVVDSITPHGWRPGRD
ncbi:hypothetical protein [Micromonospora sp. WMMD737]|uniref:hypothetical protein n=1 Tax=Micromonospora sp. WMMD737 TaxID=3404113 RepID=UPI003B925CE3